MLKEIKKVEKLVKRWKNQLFLQDWDIEVVEGKNSKGEAMLYVEPDPAYLNAKIYVCPLFKQLPEEVKEECVVHELVHCINAEFSDLFSALLQGELVTQKQKFDSEERVTQRLTRIILKTLNKSNS